MPVPGPVRCCIGCMIVIVMVAAPVSADIYKWVDENGRTHYGERPPDNNADPVDIDKGPEVKDTVRPHEVDWDKLLQVLEEEREQKREEQRRIEQEKEERAQKCNKVKKRLALLERGSVFYRENENGEREYLTGEEVQQEYEKLQAVRDKHCR